MRKLYIYLGIFILTFGIGIVLVRQNLEKENLTPQIGIGGGPPISTPSISTPRTAQVLIHSANNLNSFGVATLEEEDKIISCGNIML